MRFSCTDDAAFQSSFACRPPQQHHNVPPTDTTAFTASPPPLHRDSASDRARRTRPLYLLEVSAHLRRGVTDGLQFAAHRIRIGILQRRVDLIRTRAAAGSALGIGHRRVALHTQHQSGAKNKMLLQAMHSVAVRKW